MTRPYLINKSMIHFSPQKSTNFLKILLIVFLLIGLTFLLKIIGQHITVEGIKDLVQKFGIAAPLIYILLTASTNVFSPIAALPFWIAGILIFPSAVAFGCIYSANLLGHSLNFLIAKHWGRTLIAKFVGQKGLAQIDKFTNLAGIKTIFIIRLIGGAATDYVSYALGLTSLKFPTYFLINTIAFLPWAVVNFYFIHQALNSKLAIAARNLTFITLLGYLATIIFSFIIYHLQRKRQPLPPL
ncbi:MAG: hypothetical protein DRH56_07360 [Deltaproteobacteria bacterium]|nr:MAG: hypothetical protein DRH56_07360 [Deltaproteobacteria bacterium]